MAAPTGIESFAEDLRCPICLELFSDPVMLECGHNYCQACIARFWAEIPTNPEENASPPFLTCPECRREIPGGKYTPNRALGQLACKAQESLLTQAGDEEVNGDGGDEEMQGEKLFCTEDGCLTRALQPEHWGHQCLPLAEAVEHFKGILVASQRQLEFKIQTERSVQEQRAQKPSEITAQRRHLEQNISAQFTELRQWLQEKEAALVREINREEKLLLSELDRNQRSSQEQIRTADEQIAKIQAQLAMEPDPESFLKDIKGFMERYCQGEDKTSSPQPVISRDFNLGQFKGPIQYMVWREMLLDLRPFPSYITLDPDTNHPNLVLSKDFDTVRLEDNPKEEVPDGPERFSKTVCVLGTQGFTSGCHYWEVEVGNKTSWDIGVAKESVNRKEAKVTVKPSNGFWAIWLRNGNEYKALDSPSRQLFLKIKPEKVGVYLDYDGGQVSFYDADAMTHIYTFLDVFSECLYPMFSPGVNKDGLNGEPLRLLAPRI